MDVADLFWVCFGVGLVLYVAAWLCGLPVPGTSKEHFGSWRGRCHEPDEPDLRFVKK